MKEHSQTVYIVEKCEQTNGRAGELDEADRTWQKESFIDALALLHSKAGMHYCDYQIDKSTYPTAISLYEPGQPGSIRLRAVTCSKEFTEFDP